MFVCVCFLLVIFHLLDVNVDQLCVDSFIDVLVLGIPAHMCIQCKEEEIARCNRKGSRSCQTARQRKVPQLLCDSLK